MRMTTLLTTAKLSVGAGAIAVGSSVIAGADLIGPDTHISLGVALTLASVLVGAAFTIARQVQRWEDVMKAHSDALTKMEAKLESLHKGLDALPCEEVNCKPANVAPRFKTPHA